MEAEAVEVETVEVVAVEPPVAPPQVFSVSELQTQVETANAYPRSVADSMRDLHVLANENQSIAQTMYYSLPRGNKKIPGPSIRFAETLVYVWGNIRVYGRVVETTATEVVAEGYAWDIQKNAAIAKQVRRRIVDRDGNRYNIDMVVVTGNAAISLAIRNAVLSVIPRSLWASAYEATLKTALGSKSIAEIREDWIEWWAEQERTTEELWAFLGIMGPKDLKAHELRHLLGLRTAIDEGMTTLDWEIRKAMSGKDTPDELRAFADALAANASKAPESPESAEGTGDDPSEGDKTSDAPESGSRDVETETTHTKGGA